MAEFPALPLWTDAYLGDTTHLSGLQHGAYLLLLITAWRNKDCRLADDDTLLAKWARVTPGQWARLRPIIEPFWQVKDGYWFNDRLSDERATVSLRSKKASDAGRASALKRQNRNRTPVQPNASSVATSTPTPTPTPKADSKSWVNHLSDALGFDITTNTRFLPQVMELQRQGLDILLDLVPVVQEMRAAGRVPADLRSLGYFREAALARKAGREIAAQAAQERAQTPFEPTDRPGWVRRLRAWLDGGYWPPAWGPRPRSGACQAPADLVKEAVENIWVAQGGHPAGAFPADPNGRWAEWDKLRDLRNNPDCDYGDGPLPGGNVVQLRRV